MRCRRKGGAHTDWTRANYDKMMGYVYSIEDRGIRSLVLDFVNNPRSTVFDATVDKNAYRYAPAAGGPGHHFYPGGLAVHAVENIEISLGWSNVMSSIHGVNNVNRDIVIASLVLHDWAKVWYNWDEKNGVSRPTWYPEYWGGQEGIAKWKWMGGHGAIVYAELMKRGAPAELIIGTAAAHFDAYSGSRQGQGQQRRPERGFGRSGQASPRFRRSRSIPPSAWPNGS